MISIVIIHSDDHPYLRTLTENAIRSVHANTADYQLICVENKGTSVAASYNKGFEQATGDHYCCLHNDTEVSSGWSEELIRVAGSKDIAFPWPEEDQSNPEARGIGKTPEWMPTGCCFMMSADLFRRLHGFDEQFAPYHWEDVDLFYRAQKVGARLRRAPVRVLHHRGATRSFHADKGDGALIENRNRWIKKHIADAEDGVIPYPVMET